MVRDSLSIGGRHTVPFQLTGINALITFFVHRFLIPQINHVAVGIAKFSAVPPGQAFAGICRKPRRSRKVLDTSPQRPALETSECKNGSVRAGLLIKENRQVGFIFQCHGFVLLDFEFELQTEMTHVPIARSKTLSHWK